MVEGSGVGVGGGWGGGGGGGGGGCERDDAKTCKTLDKERI